MDVGGTTRVANLGVNITLQGGAQATAQLNDLGAAGETAGKRITTAFGPVTAEVARLTIAQQALVDRANALAASAATLDAANKGAMAAFQAETNAVRALSTAMQQQQLVTAQLATASAALAGVEGGSAGIHGVGTAATVGAVGLGRIRMGLISLIAQATGTIPVLDRIGGAFLTMGVGGNVAIAVIAGIAALALAWRYFTADTRAAQEALDKAGTSAIEFYEKAKSAGEKFTETQIKVNDLLGQQAEKFATLMTLERAERAQGHTGVAERYQQQAEDLATQMAHERAGLRSEGSSLTTPLATMTTTATPGLPFGRGTLLQPGPLPGIGGAGALVTVVNVDQIAEAIAAGQVADAQQNTGLFAMNKGALETLGKVAKRAPNLTDNSANYDKQIAAWDKFITELDKAADATRQFSLSVEQAKRDAESLMQLFSSRGGSGSNTGSALSAGSGLLSFFAGQQTKGSNAQRGLGAGASGLGALSGIYSSSAADAASGGNPELGGTLSGAASGAEIGMSFGGQGAVIGAGVGAAAGFVTSLLGAKNAAQQFAIEMQNDKDKVAASLADWAASITKSAADEKTASLLDAKVKYEEIVQSIEQLEAGKKMEAQRNADLATAAQLYAEQTNALQNNIVALNVSTEAFLGLPSTWLPALDRYFALQGGTTGGSGVDIDPVHYGGGSGVSASTVILQVDGVALGKVVLNSLGRSAQINGTDVTQFATLVPGL